MLIFIQCIVALVALKALTVGSDFSLYLWIRYGSLYMRWYIRRPSNKDFSVEKMLDEYTKPTCHS